MLVQTSKARYFRERLYKVGDVFDWPDDVPLGQGLTRVGAIPAPPARVVEAPMPLSKMAEMIPLQVSGGGPPLGTSLPESAGEI